MLISVRLGTWWLEHSYDDFKGVHFSGLSLYQEYSLLCPGTPFSAVRFPINVYAPDVAFVA